MFAGGFHRTVGVARDVAQIPLVADHTATIVPKVRPSGTSSGAFPASEPPVGDLVGVGDISVQARFFAPLPSPTVPIRAEVSYRLSAAAGRVAIVYAPGGYGKTSQVAGWAARDRRATAWADLERLDNDPTILVTVLVRLLTQVTDFDVDELPTSRRSPDEIATVVVPAFGRLVARCRTPFVIVLDDAHLIEAPAAIDFLDALARNVPPASTVVLAGRAEPGTSLGRLRLHPGVVEVSMTDLALGASDADQLFTSMGLALEQDDVIRLVEHTEGWPVGLRLAGLAILGASDTNAAVAAFSGDDRYVVAYLRDEWMSGLSTDDAHFVMRVGCLGWFSGPMCDEVLDRVGSSKLLERLHAKALLVIPLDRRQGWYRVHHLLGEFLREELGRTDPAALRQLHQRASAWCEVEHDIDRAFHHALQSDDLARSESLVQAYAPAQLTTGCQATVRRWLSSFPDGYVQARPPLCVIAAATAIGLGEGETCACWLRFLEHALASTDQANEADRMYVLMAAFFRAMIGIAPLAELVGDAELAYAQLPPGPWHASVCSVLGGLLIMQGDEQRARTILTEGAAEAKIVRAPTLQAICLAHLALVLDDAGDRDLTQTTARSAREVLRADGVQDVSTTMMALAMSALVEARGGNVECARDDWLRARRHLAGFDSVAPWLNVLTRLVLARTSLLLGDHVAARTLLDEAHRHLRLQPEAAWPRARLAELDATVDTAHEVLPYGPSSLTTAELRVLQYLPTNLRFGDIADRLFVSKNTAKSHASAIYRKLGTNSRGETVELARRSGLVPASGSMITAP